jgi:hypothetical protein
MAAMNPPHSGAVVDVPDDLVDRYSQAGWTKVSASSSTTKKATTSKSSSKK